MASITSLRSLTLDLPPSCIEFVPGYPELFVVGTYYLERKDELQNDAEEPGYGKPQQRSGSLLLFRLDGDEVTKIDEVSIPFAAFDLHFAPPTHRDAHLLGVATSIGSLALYRIAFPDTRERPQPTLNRDHDLARGDASKAKIEHVETLQLFPETSLITYFAWHPTVSDAAGLALSDGSVYLCQTGTSTEERSALLHAHDLEAWTLAFLPDGSGIFSGGDDSVLEYRSLPSTTAPPPPPAARWQDRKTHFAGVTAILPLPPSLLLTGSYDDRIRLFSLPPPPPAASGPRPRRPALLAELDLGGGVWRLKDISRQPAAAASEGEQVLQQKEYLLLASCMHAGARILRLRADDATADAPSEWRFEILARFDEHRSMNYGSDVQPMPPSPPSPDGSAGRVTEGAAERTTTIVSTSFYDRLLCVWRW